MKLFRPVIAAVAALSIAVASATAGGVTPQSAGRWEASSMPRPQSGADLEVMTSGQWVYVASRRALRVSIITVLGQPLTEAELPAGVYRYRLASRGIYILRAASSTYRITL